MRLPLLSGAAIAVLLTALLAGCSSSGVDALDIAESVKVDRSMQTASIRPLAPIAPVPAKGVSAGQIDEQRELGFAESPDAPLVMAALRPDKPVPTPAPSRVTAGPKVYEASFTDAEPIDFGKLTPHAFPVHGVDVSRWQGDIDWHELRRGGANFAFIKATDGGDHLDPKFHENWKAAREAGVPRGAYHFFYWCRTGRSQAEWFVRNVPKEKGALPPVVDVEWNHNSKTCRKRPSPETVRKKMKAFMDMLEAHYGQRPIIYTSPDFYEDNLQNAFKSHPFWLRSVAVHPSEVYPGRDFLFWQYSGTGLSAAHDTPIDLNVFNGSLTGWHNWLAQARS